MDSVIDLNLNNIEMTSQGICNAIKKAQSTKDKLINQLSSIDLIISDHYHALEFEEKDSIYDIWKIGCSLKNALKKRRNIKDSIAKIIPFMNGLNNMKLAIEAKDGSEYHPRFITLEEIVNDEINDAYEKAKIKDLSLLAKKE